MPLAVRSRAQSCENRFALPFLAATFQMLGMLVFTLQLLFSGLLPPVTSVRSSWVWLTNSVGVTWATRFITLLQARRV